MRILCDDNNNAAVKGLMPVFMKAASLCVEYEGLDPENMEISLTFVSKKEIHDLNKMYRNVDNHTDVLSFPLVEDFDNIDESSEILLGDVVICTEKAEEQAEEYGHSMDRELVYLFVHSVHHLLGYDHMKEDEKAQMRECEERVMTALNLERSR